MTYVLLFLANIVGGTINALAGGGGLITFPLLMLTVAPVTADATSAVALFFAYPAAVWRTRGQLEGVFGHGWLWLLLVPCVLGGVVGAVLLSRTGNRNFIEFVTWLVLIATIIIVLRPILVRHDEGGSVHPDITMALWRCRNCGHFPGGIVWRLFWSRDWHSHDRRPELYLARRYPACASGMTTSRSVGHRSSFGSGFGASHGMRSMGHVSRGGGRGR